MYKKIYICKHILLYNYYAVYAYFTMDIIMHICILSFIYFNKHYIVHLHYCSNCLFLVITHLIRTCLVATMWTDTEKQDSLVFWSF